MKYRKLMVMVIMMFVMVFAFSCQPPKDDEEVVTTTTDDGGGSGGGTGGSSDTTRPTVSSTSPANSATNVSLSGNITITFSEAMQSSTINASNITMVDNSSANIAGAVSLSGSTATFNPNSNLSNDKTYTVTVSTSVTDTSSNALASNYTFSFSTPASGGGDTTAPTISSYTPSNNASNIAVNSNMTVTFNESMKSSTINNTNITLTNSGSNVAIAVSLSGNTATINPNADLNNSTQYTWTIGTGVQDVSNNALASSVSYTFTTVAGGGGGGGGNSVAAYLTPRSRLATGYNSNSYIMDNGSVVHWGYFSDENAAKNTQIVDNLTNPRQVATFGSSGNGGRHDCAIKTDNTSVCWGENSQSQLGDNTTVDCGVGSNSTTPKYQKTACAVPIFDDNTAQGNLKEVGMGEKFTVWLDNNGKVYSAGDCDSGKLGTSCGATDHKIGTTVMTGVKDIDVGRNITCAHKNDNTLHCWGENSSNGITTANSNDVETPLQIATNVDKFDVGNSFVAMVYDNGSVFCTDNFYQSQLCSSKLNYPNIKQIYATGIAGLVFDNGTQVSYGYDYQGVVADKTGNNPQLKTTVEHGWIQEGGSQSIIDNITYISAGGNGHLIAIMDNGSLVGVGGNNEGQMGGTGSNLTCYWRGNAVTPCADSSQTNDVFIYLNMSPTSVGP